MIPLELYIAPIKDISFVFSANSNDFINKSSAFFNLFNSRLFTHFKYRILLLIESSFMVNLLSLMIVNILSKNWAFSSF